MSSDESSSGEGRSREGPSGEGPTDQELEVMRLVAEGHKDATIARRLGVAPVTVHRRAQRFCRRVGARSRPHAIAIAIARGWLEVDRPDGGDEPRPDGEDAPA